MLRSIGWGFLAELGTKTLPTIGDANVEDAREKRPLRLRLVLGKFRVTEVHPAPLGPGYQAKIELGGSTTMTVLIPWDIADIRHGDLVTLYTEIPTHANTQPSPV